MAKELTDYTRPDGQHVAWDGPRSFGRKDTAPRLGSALAQVVLYEQAHGPLPAGRGIKEVCGYRYCMNVAHLSAVPVAEARRPSKLPVPREEQPAPADTLARIEAKLDLILGLLNYTPEPEPERYAFVPEQQYRCMACGADVTVSEPIYVDSATGVHNACGAPIRNVVPVDA